MGFAGRRCGVGEWSGVMSIWSVNEVGKDGTPWGLS